VQPPEERPSVLVRLEIAACRLTAAPPPHAALTVMTAALDPAAACRAAGGDACLPKPFDLDDLYTVIERHARGAV
jgi:CheY-like chemotaxis protein